ncbi:FABP family protein, partial [Frankia sp. CiP3]
MTTLPGPVVDLHPRLRPLAFLLGTWRGEGVGGYEGMDGFRYGQEVVFSSTGQPALSYESRTWWA